MTESLWRATLAEYAQRGTPSERLMAKMLLDLAILPSAGPILDGWALRCMEMA